MKNYFRYLIKPTLLFACLSFLTGCKTIIDDDSLKFLICVYKDRQEIEFDYSTILYIKASSAYDSENSDVIYGKRLKNIGSSVKYSNGVFYFDIEKKYDRLFVVLGNDSNGVYCTSYITKPRYGMTYNLKMTSGWQYLFPESNWYDIQMSTEQFSYYFVSNISLENEEESLGKKDIPFLNKCLYSHFSNAEKETMRNYFLQNKGMSAFDYWDLCLRSLNE